MYSACGEWVDPFRVLHALYILHIILPQWLTMMPYDRVAPANKIFTSVPCCAILNKWSVNVSQNEGERTHTAHQKLESVAIYLQLKAAKTQR